MPKGPNGEKRPADVIANAVLVVKIAAGQTEETSPASQGAPLPKCQAGPPGGAATQP